MKKIVLLVLLFLLTGCQKEPEFSYDDTLNSLISTFNSTQDCFVEDYTEEFYVDKSSSYRKLMELIYKESTMKLVNYNNSVITVEYLYWDYEDVYNSVINDTDGFIYDIQNLDKLGIAQSEINDYVYDYLSIMITQCNKSTREITLEIEQTTTAPFMFISNKELYTSLEVDLSKLVYDVEQYALGYEKIEEESVTEQELKVFEKDLIYLLNYSQGEDIVPISIKVLTVLRGEDAQNKLLELSPNNEGLLYDNHVYIEYEVCNYSLNDIVFQSKFFEANAETHELFTDNIQLAGISESYAITPGSTIVVRDVLLSNYGDLVWYDEQAFELYILNQE